MRLRRLEADHLSALDSVKRVEQEKVDDLSRRLNEVDGQCRRLREEVNSKSEELTATAKRWVEEISALDRGLAGKSHISLLFLCPLPAFGCRLPARIFIGNRQLENLEHFLASGWRWAAFACRLPPGLFIFNISIFGLVAGGVSRRLPPGFVFRLRNFAFSVLSLAFD